MGGRQPGAGVVVLCRDSLISAHFKGIPRKGREKTKRGKEKTLVQNRRAKDPTWGNWNTHPCDENTLGPAGEAKHALDPLAVKTVLLHTGKEG